MIEIPVFFSGKGKEHPVNPVDPVRRKVVAGERFQYE
jgi:hypothetical protein